MLAHSRLDAAISSLCQTLTYIIHRCTSPIMAVVAHRCHVVSLLRGSTGLFVIPWVQATLNAAAHALERRCCDDALWCAYTLSTRSSAAHGIRMTAVQSAAKNSAWSITKEHHRS